MKKTPIEYVSYIWEPPNTRLFIFFFDGEWDEDKLTYEQAIKRYPREEYEWKNVNKKRR